MIRRTAGLLAAAALIGACGKGNEGAADRDATDSIAAAEVAACTGTDVGITLPGGFCGVVFADSIGRGRHVVVAPSGDVYVTLEFRKSQEGEQGEKMYARTEAVAALRDTNGDGAADTVAYFGKTGGTGIALFDDHLYVDEQERIVRWPMTRGQLVPSGDPEVIVAGLPNTGDHRAHNFTIGSDGALYVNIGSATNACQKENRTQHSPGIDPCRELETRAGIWKYDARTPNQRFSAKERFATGIRNAEGLAFAPGTNQLWSTQHGRDQLQANWPEKFDAKTSAEQPQEELMSVSQGDDFGWPYCYFDGNTKQLVLAPEYGGDGKQVGRCAAKKAPAAWFPGHWAPMDLLFYSGTAFPQKYRDGAFITFHGSWNRAPEPQAGFRIVFQPMTGGKAAGQFETFAEGFAGGKLDPVMAAHRPVGMAVGPKGEMYVTDDAGGRVWRVTYSQW